MTRGKKSVAQKIVYQSLSGAAAQLKTEPLQVLTSAIQQVKPDQEVRPRRVGGATYQIPMPVKKERGETLAMHWILQVSRNRKGKTMIEKLTEELIRAYQGTGEAVKKKEDTHKMALANRAFAHFRWGK